MIVFNTKIINRDTEPLKEARGLGWKIENEFIYPRENNRSIELGKFEKSSTE